MKNKLLLALGACYALSFPIAAQNSDMNEALRDTLVITANADMKILFIGSDMETMKDYKRADSLKNFFINDLTKAREQSTYPSGSRLTHYLVHPNGKRRLKAESEDYQEPLLDVGKEIRSMDLNLPAYAYIIYDVASHCRLEIYLSNPELLSSLEKINLTEAIRSIAAGKKSQRKFSNIEIRPENGNWIRKSASSQKSKALEINSLFGIALIGGKLGPEPGLQLLYGVTDKHGMPSVRLGLVVTYYLLSDYNNKEFSNFYGVASYNISFMRPTNRFSSDRWFGIEIGRLNADGGTLDDNYKVGLIYSIKSFYTGFQIVFPDPNKNNAEQVMYGFTARFVL